MGLYTVVILVIMKTSGFYYKDRLGRSRGPMQLIQLKTAWGAGIIDKHTFIWSDDMDEWAPISMVYGMERAIATWEGLSFLLRKSYLAFNHVFVVFWSLHICTWRILISVDK